ncbi:MAG: HAD family hydrolase [Phycisphaerales bacterium]|nr:HAD family hydrolase [Phycisphaerales bacterium]
MQRAIFLDRDNTLIKCDGDLGDPASVELLEGVPDGLRQLREAGYHLIVVTNQGGVARGRYEETDVDATHQRIATLVDEAAGQPRLIDRFYYCPYHPQATIDAYRRDHPWRKPQPGMLMQAADDLDIDLKKSWMIGDQERDIDAGHAAGCRTVLITPVMSQDQEHENRAIEVVTFSDAVKAILDQPTKTKPNAPILHQPVAKLEETPEKHSGKTPSKKPTPTNRRSEQPDKNALSEIQGAMTDLAEEFRAARIQRSELSTARIIAGVCQGLAILLAILALVQLNEIGSFARTITFAGLLQLMTIAFLLFDWRR